MTNPTPLTFIDNRKPILMAGPHEIRVCQTVEHLPPGITEPGIGESTWQSAGSFEQSASFYVSAPRWHLADDQIDRVFPAPGSKGDFSQSYPYVLIDNPTLPWERSPYAQVKDGGGAKALSDAPWLALVTIDESLITDLTHAAGEVATGPARVRQVTPTDWTDGADTSLPRLIEEPTDTATPSLTVVDLAHDLIAKKGLAAERIMRHACVVQSSDAGALGTAGEHALITCPERPGPGRYRLMLLSLEGWLDPANGGLLGDDGPCNYRRFVLLGQWSFTGAKAEQARFTDIATSVGVGLLRDSDAGDDLHRQAGGRLFAHGQHSGLTTSSWRRGPLVSARLVAPPGLNPWHAFSAKALILDDSEDNLPSDASYAEAWEQGRLAALRKPILSAALADCRRACAHHSTDTGHLFCGEQGPQSPDLPTDWLSALLRLEYTPYTSLVPVENLLPPEQLRFFLVDPHWLECFLAGAVSLGRPYASADCAGMEQHFADMLSQVTGRPVSGFLLRSRLVADWPSLEVQGRTADGEVAPVRISRPSPNILMVLFAEQVQSVWLAPPPHHLHLERRNDKAQGAAEWAAANAVLGEAVRFSLRSSG